jgi:phosphoribosylglycinamide formyltransferase-1
VLISGQGTNLQALIDTARKPGTEFTVSAVFSDQAAAPGLDRARAAGIPAHHIDPKQYPDRRAFDAALGDAIDRYRPDLIVLAGFMRILDAEFVTRYADRMLNIHPSLLPKFKGLHTHRRALEAGESEHGATVHFVTAELDGGPPVLQYRLPIHAGETEDTLSARVHRGEYIILPRAVRWFAAGRLRIQSGIALFDDHPLADPISVAEEND